VRKAVVNSCGHPADSVWKSIFPRAIWPLLVGQKESNEERSTGRPSAVEQDNAQTSETKQGDVLGGPPGVRAQYGRYRRGCTRNDCGRTASSVTLPVRLGLPSWTRSWLGNGTPPSWPSCGTHTAKPTRRRSANPWWAIGGRSICSRSNSRGHCSGPRSS
jgi:hypothetical protein